MTGVVAEAVFGRVSESNHPFPLIPAQWLPKPATRWIPQDRKPLRGLWSLGERVPPQCRWGGRSEGFGGSSR